MCATPRMTSLGQLAALTVAAAAVVSVVFAPRPSAHIQALPAVAEHAAAGRYFNWNGLPVFFRSEVHPGSHKPVLLLLHGFPTSSFDWVPLLPRLRRHFDVVAPDFTGHGLSYKDRAGADVLTMVSNADMVDALMASLGVTSYHVLAHGEAWTPCEGCCRLCACGVCCCRCLFPRSFSWR